MTFTFCQAPNADRWHIRKVASGKRLGGGADTAALCGKTVKWDLSLPLTDSRLVLCCADCAALYAVKEDKAR